MRHHAADGGADLGGAGRVLLHAGDLTPHPFVERRAQFGAVGADLVEFGIHRRQHAARHRRAERPSHQPAALLAHPLLDGGAQRVLAAGEQVANSAEDEAEHLLVAAALDQAVQRARHHPAGAGAAHHARHQAGDQPPGAAVLHGGQQLRQHAGERQWRRDAPRRVGQEAVQDARQVEPAQHPGDLVGR